MAIQGITSGGRIKTLTAKEVKAENMRLLGLSGAEGTKEYQKIYDRYRLRVRNYEKLIGATKPRNVAEQLYSELRRESLGMELTAEQQAIRATSSASTGAFGRRVAAEEARSGEEGYTRSTTFEAAANALTGGVFAGLIEKSEKTRNALIEYLNDHPQASPAEINALLKAQAKSLHERQRAAYAANRAVYAKGGGRRVGSD